MLQLSRQREALFLAVVDFYETNHRDARDPAFGTLRKVLLEILKGFETVFVVFDALDECEERKELMCLFRELVGDGIGCTIKLFITSRRESDIQKSFHEIDSIEIEATKISSDIKAYVNHEIDQRSQDGRLELSSKKLRGEIVSSLIDRAGGMYVLPFPIMSLSI